MGRAYIALGWLLFALERASLGALATSIEGIDGLFANKTAVANITLAAPSTGSAYYSAQRRLCNAVTPFVGVWFAGYLLCSTAMLIAVVAGLRQVGAIYAMPSLAGIRYNLFSCLWAQGMAQIIQAFRESPRDGCYVPHQFLLIANIPMQLGPIEASPLPGVITGSAMVVETILCGYISINLLISMPRLRLQFCPENQIHKTVSSRKSALPACIMLLLVNPIVTVIAVQDSLTLSLILEFLCYGIGLSFCFKAGIEERSMASKLFDDIYAQEWIVLAASVGTRIGKLLIAAFFHDQTASFLNAFISTVSTLAVLGNLCLTSAPWNDPLMWLIHIEEKGGKDQERRAMDRRTLLTFFFSMFNIQNVLALALKFEDMNARRDTHGDTIVRLVSEKSESEPLVELRLMGFRLNLMILTSEELRLGQEACMEWARWAEKVGPTWPGLRDDRWSDELTNVEPPTMLTPQEKELAASGELRWRSKWAQVFGDLFSDRVHSQVIAVIWTVIILTEPVTWSVLTRGRQETSGWWGTVSIFFSSLAFCLGMWVLLALLLLGNNVFLPLLRCGNNGRRLWLLVVCGQSIYAATTQLFDMLETIGHTNSDRPFALLSPMGLDSTGLLEDRSLRICWSFLHFSLALQLFTTSLQQACISRLPAVRNTYHRLEFAAQRYCQKLLEGELRTSASITGIKGLAENQIFQMWSGGTRRPCRVIRVAQDGTCTAVLQGGQAIENVLFKELEPLHTEARLIKQDKKAFVDMMEGLSPSLDVVRDNLTKRVSITAKALHQSIRHSSKGESSISASPAQSEGADFSNKGTMQSMGARLTSFGGFLNHSTALDDHSLHHAQSRTFSEYKESVLRRASVAGGKLEGMLNKMESQNSRPVTPGISDGRCFTTTPLDLETSVLDEALVSVACEEGKSRAKHVKSQRKQSAGFRVFFNASVGLSGLMLTALLIGPMLVILCSTFLAVRTTAFEMAISRMWHGGAYALRIRSQGFHYGACAPPSELEVLACEMDIGTGGACGDAPEMLLLTFDLDRSTYLEPLELDAMSAVMAGISSGLGSTEDDPKPILRSKEFRSLTQAAAAPGPDLLDHQGIGRFLCLVSRLLKEQEDIEDEAVNDGISLDDMTDEVLFLVADRSPKNGFLTEHELLGILPASILERTPWGIEALRLYTSALRVGFMLGDDDPMDGQLSRKEGERAFAPMAHLVRHLPKLAKHINDLQEESKNRAPPRDRRLMDFNASTHLDIDRDGYVSRPEMGVLAAVLASSRDSAALADQVLPLFDQLDLANDGRLEGPEADLLWARITALFPLQHAMASQDLTAEERRHIALALDSDGDGLTRKEFDSISMFFPPQHGRQAPFISSLIFMQSDVAPADGRLSNQEFEVAVNKVQALYGVPEGQDIPTVPPDPSTPLDRIDMLWSLLSLAGSTLFEGDRPIFARYIHLFLEVFHSELFSIILPAMIFAMRISILGAVFSASYMMLRTKTEHEKLTQRIQMGDHEYTGHTHREKLRNSFAQSTSFPGFFIATVVINFFVATFLIFCCMMVLITPPLLLAVPHTRHFVYHSLLILRYPLLAGFVKYVLKKMWIDRYLVKQGQPVYPQFFAPLWLSLLLINFVQAPFFAVLRWGFIVIRATVSSTFLHICAFSEALVFLDHGYISFISMTFTQSTRRNLVRTCFISAIMPQAQRVRSKCPPNSAQMRTEEAEERRRRLRVRNKLWVAVTLRNNPSLRKDRRVSREREFSSLTMLWGDHAHHAHGGASPRGSGDGLRRPVHAKTVQIMEHVAHDDASSPLLEMPIGSPAASSCGRRDSRGSRGSPQSSQGFASVAPDGGIVVETLQIPAEAQAVPPEPRTPIVEAVPPEPGGPVVEDVAPLDQTIIDVCEKRKEMFAHLAPNSRDGSRPSAGHNSRCSKGADGEPVQALTTASGLADSYSCTTSASEFKKTLSANEFKRDFVGTPQKQVLPVHRESGLTKSSRSSQPTESVATESVGRVAPSERTASRCSGDIVRTPRSARSQGEEAYFTARSAGSAPPRAGKEAGDTFATPASGRAHSPLAVGSVISSVRAKLEGRFEEEARAASARSSGQARASPREVPRSEASSPRSCAEAPFNVRELLFKGLGAGSCSATEVESCSDVGSLAAGGRASRPDSEAEVPAAGAPSATTRSVASSRALSSVSELKASDASLKESCVAADSDTWSCGTEPQVEAFSTAIHKAGEPIPMWGAGAVPEDYSPSRPSQSSSGLSPRLDKHEVVDADGGGTGGTPLGTSASSRHIRWNPVPEVREFPRVMRNTPAAAKPREASTFETFVGRLSHASRRIGLADFLPAGLAGSQEPPCTERPSWSVTPRPVNPAGSVPGSVSPQPAGSAERTGTKTSWSRKGTGKPADVSGPGAVLV